MLPWWGWVLVWVVILVGGAALIAWLGWRVWGKVKALGREIADAERAADALQAQVDRIGASSGADSRGPGRVPRPRVGAQGTRRRP